MPPEAQSEAAPVSTAPKTRDVVCFHEAGHAVAVVLIVGKIGGVRLEPGGGLVWRGSTPEPDAIQVTEGNWRERFSDNENLLFVCGPVPFAIVNQHMAKWRGEAIISLAGQEAERLAFGLVVSSPNSDLLSAKTYTRRCSFSRAGANILLDHCRAEARALLQRYWSAVEAIARALDQEEELSGEDVARLIAQNQVNR